MAITKFDREQIAMGERAVRQENIKKIDAMIAECEDLLAVIPGRPKATLEQVQERDFMLSRRAWLYEMLEEEQKAYNNAGIDPEELKAAMPKLN